MEHCGSTVTKNLILGEGSHSPYFGPGLYASRLRASTVYLLKLFLDKQKQEQNKQTPFPNLFHFSCQLESKVVGTTLQSWSYTVKSPSMTPAKGPGTSSPAQECCRNFPRYSKSQIIYRAQGSGVTVPRSILLASWVHSARRGDRSDEVVVGPSDQRGALFSRFF